MLTSGQTDLCIDVYLSSIHSQIAPPPVLRNLPSTFFKCQSFYPCHFLGDLSPGPLPCSSPADWLIFRLPSELWS